MKNFTLALSLLTLTIFNSNAIDFIVDDDSDLSVPGDGSLGDGLCLRALPGGGCSLRAAIDETNALPGSHRIIIPNGTYHMLQGTLSILNSDVEIIGAGINETIIDGNLNGQVFYLNGSNVTFNNLSIINGKATVDNPTGGGINAYSGSLGTADLNINNVKFKNNSANMGGALRTLDMNVIITKSIFTENTLDNLGVTNIFGSAISVRRGNIDIYNSGIYYNVGGVNAINIADSIIFMQNSTVSNNNSIGLRTQNTLAKINFSTFSNNSVNLSHYSFDGSQSMNISNSIVQNASSLNCGSSDKPTSNGYNISDDVSCEMLEATDMESTDAQLNSLWNNGGKILSHFPASTSPAVDMIPIVNCIAIDTAALTVDQRGWERPVSSLCDSGAIEFSDIIYMDGFE